MRYIEHIIEPTKLLLAWQSSDRTHRRYIVAESIRAIDNQINLTYLVNTEDFRQAQAKGFEFYPLFQGTTKTYYNVLNAFMRRLPPRTRGDFPQYMEGLRLKPDVQLSDYALLGYSGAKLPSDEFSIIHPFNTAEGACELLLEAAGFSHLSQDRDGIKVDDQASFTNKFNDATQADAIRIIVNEQHIGYVNRGLISTFVNWIDDNRIIGAWVEKINGTPSKPTVYIYIKISSSR